MSEEYALSIRAADGSSHTYEVGTVTHIHLHSGSGLEVGYIGDLGKGGIWIDVGRTALFMPADVVAAIADYVTAKEWAALSDEYEKEGTFRVMCQNTWNGATQEVDDHIILSEN